MAKVWGPLHVRLRAAPWHIHFLFLSQRCIPSFHVCFPFFPSHRSFSGLRSLTHTPTTMVKQVMPGTSAAEFRRQMEGQAFTLVDFYAEWCGPCKMIAPQVDQLAMLHPHITFLKACPLPSSPFPLCAIAWSCDVDFFLGFVECCPAPLFSAAASASAGERAGGLEW